MAMAEYAARSHTLSQAERLRRSDTNTQRASYATSSFFARRPGLDFTAAASLVWRTAMPATTL
jgi:hypothetical protein